MRKAIVLLTIASLLAALGVAVLAGAVFTGAEDGVVTASYKPASGGATDYVRPVGSKSWVYWDLTKRDLQLTYLLDMSLNTMADGPLISEVGVTNKYGQQIGWMESCPQKTEQYETGFDQNDLLALQNNRPGDNRYTSYDVLKQGDVYKVYDPYPSWAPPWAFWNNCGIWFDRGEAKGTLQAGIYDGRSCNTGGKYLVNLTFHALTNDKGAMFATVNGVPTGFYALDDYNPSGEPQFVPVGKTFDGDMTCVQLYTKIIGQNVIVPDMTAVGAAAAPTITNVWPTEAYQGTKIKGFKLNGTNFRDVSSTIQLKRDYRNTFSTTEVNWNDKTEVWTDGLAIPDTAAGGPYDVNFWHNDDKVVATYPAGFTVLNAPPQILSIGGAHCRPGQTVTVDIKGKYFRNTPMSVFLQYGNEKVYGKNIRWISSTNVKADFSIPAGSTISCNWDLWLHHNDDQRDAWLPASFSVDARMDIINPFGVFNWIWLRAPGILKVVLYSEGNFDATTIFPLAVELGGSFPIACNPQDVNHDGKIDQVYYFWNMSVNLPVGYNRPVRMLGADWSLKRIQAWDTVKVFWFLF